MRLITRAALSEPAQRTWLACFGLPKDSIEMPIETEEQRVWAAAVVFSDDLRYLPEYGLADAPAEERLKFALLWCRLLRDAEAGRLGSGDTSAESGGAR